MAQSRDSFVDFVTEQFSILGEITSRKMFGGYCLYCDGVVFALIADGAVFLKVDDETRPAYEAKGLAPFKPFDDQPVTMQYYPAPPEVYEDPDELRRWVGGAVAAGRRAVAKRKPRKKR
jgi:DNA transformation protein and related proteins